MTFSVTFLSVLIYGVLVWSVLAAGFLLYALVKEWRAGHLW